MNRSTTLRDFNGLVNMIENPYLRREFDEWAKNNIREFGIAIHVSREDLEHTKGGPKYLEFRRKRAAHEIGEKILAECALRQTEPYPYGERTTFRVFVLKYGAID